MEDGLGPERQCRRPRWMGLNPCFNGRWSRTLEKWANETPKEVLILVLMEDGLGQTKS